MIKEEHLENQVVITDTSIGMRLAFPSTMLFDRGRADLKEDAKKVLDKFWNVLHKAEYRKSECYCISKSPLRLLSPSLKQRIPFQSRGGQT